MSDSRRDLPSVNASNFLSRVRETLQGYLGTNGNVMDRGVTVRDLADAGIVRVNPTFINSGTGTPIIGAGSAVGSGGGTTVVVTPGGGTTPEYTPDLTKPPAPTGFFVGAGLTTLQGGISAPTYTAGHGHDRAIVYGATYSGTGPLPTFSSAVEITRFTGSIFAYPTTPATTWHLWVTHLSKDGVESDPAGGLHGVVASTGQDIPLILDALSGQIGDGALTPELQSSIAQGVDAASAAAWLGNNYVVRTTVSVDGRTLVGGFSLAGVNSGTQGAEIEFGVAANRFWIGSPQVPGVTGVTAIKPFVVQTTETVTANGVVIPKGVYMDAAFIINLEAAVARLGTAWIKTAMIGEAQIVAAQIQSVDASTVTTGQLSAERISGRGLVIQNEEGDILLDARGSAVPPWVVQVANTMDPGSVPLASPVDLFNRARIRSIVADGEHLRAQVSGSGNSVVLSTGTTEVWAVTYAANVIQQGGDFRELDKTRFTMQPGTYYRFEIHPLFSSPTNDTVSVYCLPPLGSVGHVVGGDAFTQGGSLFLLGTRSAPSTAPRAGSVAPFVLYVRSGPSGGTVRFLTSSANDIAALEWTHMRVFQMREVVTPVGNLTRAGTEVDFRTGLIVAPSGLSIQPAGGAFEFQWNVTLTRTVGALSYGLAYSMPAVKYDLSRGRQYLEIGLWSGRYDAGERNWYSTLLNPMFGSAASIPRLPSGTTVGTHGSILRVDMIQVPESEAFRWGFNLRRTLFSAPNTDYYGIPSSESWQRYPLLATNDTPNYGAVVTSDGLGVLTALPDWDTRVGEVNLGANDQTLPKSALVEYEYFFDFVGEPVTTPKRFRINFDIV